MTTLQEKIAVMEAFSRGVKFELRMTDSSWMDSPDPSWNWGDYEWRIKREPREWWIVFRDKKPLMVIAQLPIALGTQETATHVREVID